VLINDDDVDIADTLTIVSYSQPSSGLVADNGDGTFTYTPNADSCGVDTFGYTVSDGAGATDTATVTVSVTCVNDAPVAGDDSYPAFEDTPLVISTLGVLINDTDIDSSTVSAAQFSTPTGGTLTSAGADGSFRFVPPSNSYGAFSFTYQACDDAALCDSATVMINVGAVNDAPVAFDDSYVRAEEDGASLAIDAPGLLANDTDVDNVTEDLTAILESDATFGTVTLTLEGQSRTAGGFTYTPDFGYFGSDQFYYRAFDGTNDSDPALVSIDVQYGFIGLLSPWRENPVYKMKLGSAMPVRWQYTDPGTGLVVESSGAEPFVLIREIDGNTCSPNAENGVELFKTPGNSTYQYDTRLDIHQLNWDTTGARFGFYNVYVGSVLTGQVNGNFCVKVGKK